MDVVDIAGAAALSQQSQTNGAIGIAVMKQAAAQQQQVAALVEQAVAATPTPDPQYGFSVYA